jgi:hypothetical protein
MDNAKGKERGKTIIRKRWRNKLNKLSGDRVSGCE